MPGPKEDNQHGYSNQNHKTYMALTAKQRKQKQRALDKKEGFVEISFRVRVDRVPVIREFVKELIKHD